MSNALLRILTALIGAPILLGATYLGGWYFGLLMALLAVLAQVELYVLLEQASLRPWKNLGLVMGALVALSPLIPQTLPLAYAVGLVLLAWLPFTSDDQPLPRLGSTLLGVFYPVMLLVSLVNLRLARGPEVGDREAFLLTLSVFVLIWCTDILAYYTGRALGKHLLAPRVSPKKTWEGAVGGAFGAILGAVALKLTLLSFLSWTHLLALALICGILSQLGDLAESRLKRSVGAKDSGSILPGHGGILDRFDAMILAAPLVYLYLYYIARIIH